MSELPPPPPHGDAPPPGWSGGQPGGWQPQPGPGQPWPGQTWPGQPWPGQPFGFGPPSQNHPQGTTVLVLGILSLVICGLLGPVAWIMGNNAIKEMNARPDVSWSNRGMVTAGRICGIITSVLLGVLILSIVLVAVGRGV